jgi:hypothetical protein
MKTLIRWLLIVPASVAAWYLALVVGIMLLAAVSGLCPPDQLVSGACTAPWYQTASLAVLCFGAGLAATLILIVSTLLAPTHKRQAAVATYIIGAAVACMMGIAATEYAAMASAIVVGAAILALLLRRLRYERDREISRS